MPAPRTRPCAGLFANADVFLWLQNDWRSSRSTMTIGQSERILESWPGRSVHFHWFHDPGNPDPDHPSNKALDLVYQNAVLNLDYAALGRRHARSRRALAERELTHHHAGGHGSPLPHRRALPCQ